MPISKFFSHSPVHSGDFKNPKPPAEDKLSKVEIGEIADKADGLKHY